MTAPSPGFGIAFYYPLRYGTMAGSAWKNPPIAHVALAYDVMVAHLVL